VTSCELFSKVVLLHLTPILAICMGRFFGTPPSGADGGRKSGDTPETPSGAASLDPASKKPTPVKILATPVSSILRCRRSSGGLAPLAHRSSCARCLARVVPGPCLLALQLQVLVGN